MDFQERGIIRKKKELLLKAISLTQNFEQQALNQGLISKVHFKKLKKYPGRDRADVFLEFLEESDFSKNHTFQKLCYFLEEHFSTSWIADEMKAELSWLTQRLVVDDYVKKETEFILNKVYGDLRTMNLSRTTVAALLNGRYQVAKEAWKHQMYRNKNAVELERMSYKEAVDLISKDTGAFLKSNKEIVMQYNAEEHHEEESFKDSCQANADVFLLKHHVDVLQNIVQNIAKENEKLMQEKKRSLQRLGETNMNTRMDVILHDTLQKHAEDLGFKNSEAESNGETVLFLTKQVKNARIEADKELFSQRQRIEMLQKMFKEKEQAVREKENQIDKLYKEIDITKTKTDYWKTRSELLEKTRQLGYKQSPQKLQHLQTGKVAGSSYAGSSGYSTPSNF